MYDADLSIYKYMYNLRWTNNNSDPIIALNFETDREKKQRRTANMGIFRQSDSFGAASARKYFIIYLCVVKVHIYRSAGGSTVQILYRRHPWIDAVECTKYRLGTTTIYIVMKSLRSYIHCDLNFQLPLQCKLSEIFQLCEGGIFCEYFFINFFTQDFGLTTS